MIPGPVRERYVFEGAPSQILVPMGQQKLTMVEIPVNNRGNLKMCITSDLVQ